MNFHFLLRIAEITGDLFFFLRRTSAWIVLTRRIFVFLPVMVLMSSCTKDYFDFDRMKEGTLTTEVALPLAHSTMTIADLMKSESDSGTLQVDSNLFCTLIYSGQAMRVSSNDLIDLPDQSFHSQIQLTQAIAGQINSQGSLSVSFEHIATLNVPNQVALDSLTYKNGQMWLSMNMRIPADVLLTITIPSATLNGVPFSTQLFFHYTGTLPVSQSMAVNLAGYKFDLTNNGTANNKLKVLLHFDITHTGTAITSNHRLNMTCNINGFSFTSIYGYFGQQTFLSEYDTINISIFNTLDAFSTFEIAKPEIKISFNNSIGVPIRASVVNMKGTDGDFSDLIVAHGFPNPLPIASPAFNQIGQTLSGNFTMTTSNSNVKPLISAKPKYLLTKIESTINPDGNTGLNFMTDSSSVSVDVEVKLPLHGTASGFVLRDTVDFNYNHLQNVQSMTIRTYLTNGFPFEANWQVYFADASFQILDSLVTTGDIYMPSATVDPVNGKVKSPSARMSDNSLDRQRIIRIMNARYLIIKAHAATFRNGNVAVKIYADYSFKVQLGVIAKISL